MGDRGNKLLFKLQDCIDTDFVLEWDQETMDPVVGKLEVNLHTTEERDPILIQGKDILR